MLTFKEAMKFHTPTSVRLVNDMQAGIEGRKKDKKERKDRRDKLCVIYYYLIKVIM